VVCEAGALEREREREREGGREHTCAIIIQISQTLDKKGHHKNIFFCPS
jgi:hypothetical protein